MWHVRCGVGACDSAAADRVRKAGRALLPGRCRAAGTGTGDVLMVGDDIEADVGGAQTAGLKGALVRTGKFRPTDFDAQIRPDIVWESVADLPRWWDKECD